MQNVIDVTIAESTFFELCLSGKAMLKLTPKQSLSVFPHVSAVLSQPMIDSSFFSEENQP